MDPNDASSGARLFLKYYRILMRLVHENAAIRHAYNGDLPTEQLLPVGILRRYKKVDALEASVRLMLQSLRKTYGDLALARALGAMKDGKDAQTYIYEMRMAEIRIEHLTDNTWQCPSPGLYIPRFLRRILGPQAS